MNRKRFFALITSFALMATLAAPISAMTTAEMQEMIEALNAQIALLQQQLADLTGGSTTTPSFTGIPADFTFTRNLRLGSSGDDVKYLQIILNSDPDTRLSESGVGAPGQETSYFGPLTEAAVIKFQEKYADTVLAPHGLSTGTGFVGTTTRAKLNQILVEATEPEVPLPPVEEEEEEEEPSVPVDGLSVSVGPNNPAATTIIADSTNGGQGLVPALHLTFTGNGTVNTIKFNRTGISADSDIDNVYLYDGDTRLAEMQSLSNRVVTFYDASGLFTVSGSRNIMLRYDLNKSASAGKTIGFTLSAVGDITGTVNISGSFPMTGPQHNVATITDMGALVVTKVANSTAVDPGTVDFDVMKFTLQAQNQTVEVRKLSFLMLGSVDTGDIVNLKLHDGVSVLATVASVSSDRTVTFDLSDDPLVLSPGISRNMSLKAEILKGSARKVQFSLQRSADVVAYDTNYGVHTTPWKDSVGTAFAPITSDEISISAGSLSLQKAATSPSGNIVLNAVNQELGRWELKAVGENIRVSQISFRLVQSGTDWTSMNSVRVYYDGSQVGTTATTLAKDTVRNLAVNFVVPAGETKILTINANVSGTGVGASDGVTARIEADGITAQRMTSLTSFTLPVSDDDANGLVIQDSALGISSNSAQGAITVVGSTSDALVGSWLLTAGYEGVDLSTVTVEKNAASTFPTLCNSLTLKRGGSAIAPIISSPSDAVQSFSLTQAVSIPAGTSVQLDLYCNVISSPTWTGGHAIKLAASGIGQSTSTAVTGAATAGQGITSAAAGTLTVTVDASSPLVQQHYMGDSGVVLGVWKFEANNVEDLSVSKLTVENNSGTNSGNVNSLKLYVDGSQVGSEVPALVGHKAAFIADPLFTVPKGESKLVTLKGDVTSFAAGATAGGAVDFKIDVPGAITGATDLIVRGVSGNYALASAATHQANAQYSYRSVLSSAIALSGATTDRTRLSNELFGTITLSSSGSVTSRIRAYSTDSNAADATTNFFAADSAPGAAGIAADTSISIDGTSIKATPTTDLALTKFGYAPSSAIDLSGYRYVSFWVRTDEARTAGQFKFALSEDDATLSDTVGTDANLPALTANQWSFVEIDLDTISSAASDRDAVKSYGLLTTSTANAVIYLDQINFYNDRIKLDVSGSFAAVGTSEGSRFRLTDTVGNLKATGYYYGTTSSGTVTLIPSALVEAGTGGTDYRLRVDSNTLVASNGSLTVELARGTVGTEGAFRWYDQGLAQTSFVNWINPGELLSINASYKN